MKHMILLIVLAIFSAFAAEADESRYLHLVELADSAIAHNRWSEAETLYLEAISMDPDNPSNILLHSNIGMLQYYDGRYDEALATLTRVHLQSPASVTVLMNRAKVYTSMGNISEAIADYRRVCELDSTLIEPHFYVAVMAVKQGDTATASSETALLATLAPDTYHHNMAQATLLLSQGHTAEALPYLTKVIEVEPDAATYATRALVYLVSDDLGAAADDIAAGLALDPTNGELYLYRAVLNKMRFRPDDARADAEKAILYGVPAQQVKSLTQ